MSKIEVNFLKSQESWSGKGLDLNEIIVKHPVSTFFFKWSRDKNKIFVVDRSLDIHNGCSVVFIKDQEIMIGKVEKDRGAIYIRRYDKQTLVTDDVEFWGVITYVISKV